MSWCGDDVLGRLFSDFFVETEDFLPDEGGSLRLCVSRVDPKRAAFVMRTVDVDGSVLVVIDASARRRAGQALRASLQLAQRTRHRLELIIAASIAFAAARSVDRLADILATTTAQAFAAEESAVFLADDSDTLILAAGSNPLAGYFDDTRVRAGTRQWREVVKISGPDEAEKVTPGLGRAMREQGVEALIATPIVHAGMRLGAWACFFRHPRTFDEEAVPLADALAGQAGQTLTTIQLQNQLEHAAFHDETTGLPNRRMLEERPRIDVGGAILAILFIDLDGFKAVNDRLGHDQGDEVLREVARRLSENVRDEDVLARYGGDEFVVISSVGTSSDAQRIAERLRAAVASPIVSLPEGMGLTASIGVARTIDHDEQRPLDSLIRAADHAMYRAKSAGGNRVQFSDDPNTDRP
ncbi:sensor domain-containing diguanylate cyclase [Microbacterium pygmaeum]|uniref:sensor domain-containing diguanylate cyclase n=1 Tax=Microbacterium pygmaeum TaxID=370764 RepID=UPI001E6331CE|nr:sensor domain-containing diguanylate cyclase [Microbacterium pygmaeum]